MGGGVDGAVEEVSESNGGEAVKVNIRCSNGSKFSVDIDLESTVESFKAVLSEKCEIPSEQQRLIYKGRILKDDQTLKSYGTVLSFHFLIIIYIFFELFGFFFFKLMSWHLRFDLLSD